MKLSKTGILDRKAWEEKGFTLPSYNREEVRENTKKNPRWVHFGAGNIFRAFQQY
jgi:fructuronate reductase